MNEKDPQKNLLLSLSKEIQEDLSKAFGLWLTLPSAALVRHTHMGVKDFSYRGYEPSLQKICLEATHTMNVILGVQTHYSQASVWGIWGHVLDISLDHKLANRNRTRILDFVIAWFQKQGRSITIKGHNDGTTCT